jgi:hypothetical protein
MELKILKKFNKIREVTTLVIVLFGLSACDELLSDPNVDMVKNGTLESCPSKTLDTLTVDFMSSPRWESGITEEGQTFVNVTGGIMYQEKEIVALIQFFLNLEDSTFEFNALEFNGIPQNTLMAGGLLNNMCKE